MNKSKLALIMAALALSISISAQAEASSKRKNPSPPQSQQNDESWGVGMVDISKFDNNCSDKSQLMYCGDFDGLDDD